MQKFKVQYLCKSCKQELKFSAVLYSHGVCPHCGAVSDSMTIDCIKASVPVDSSKSHSFWEVIKEIFSTK